MGGWHPKAHYAWLSHSKAVWIIGFHESVLAAVEGEVPGGYLQYRGVKVWLSWVLAGSKSLSWLFAWN